MVKGVEEMRPRLFQPAPCRITFREMGCRNLRQTMSALVFVAAAASCSAPERDARTTITFSGSALGAEGALLERQIARFEAANPGIAVRIRRTPDDATQRHQLYVQWLNARTGTPDVLQLDVVWTAEFAAAGWIASLDRFAPDVDAFFPSAIAANRWGRGDSLFALPWFVDVGMLYWRTDLLARAPRTIDELMSVAANRPASVDYGIVWQGARYEGLITVFLEYLGAFGGEIMDDRGRVAIDSPAAIEALSVMQRQLGGAAPRDVLTWHEEESRFAFQNGRALMMRNWPYAAALMNDSTKSSVAGRFAVAPMPAAPGGSATATLGGAQLAVNARSDAPDAAYRLVAFLTAPEQMLERAQLAGYYPARSALFDDPRLAAALAVKPAQARAVIEAARPRPASPIYSQLSELLQIELHRALTGQAAPDVALHRAALAMTALIDQTGVNKLMAGGGAR
jgi:multiple sugar transport system substrate-binding protein